MTPSYRQSHLTKGEEYHDKFHKVPYRKLLWELERATLDKILCGLFGKRKFSHLDFACGTGRILAHLEDRADVSVGVDVSSSMMTIARASAKCSELICADITREDVLQERRFSLITAFRFFPNAEPELREDAMKTLVRHLEPGGYLIFNVHKNTGSLLNRLLKAFGRPGLLGMNTDEVAQLLGRNEMVIDRIHGLGIIPASERTCVLPVFAMKHLERFLSSSSLLVRLGQNLIFVCRRLE